MSFPPNEQWAAFGHGNREQGGEAGMSKLELGAFLVAPSVAADPLAPSLSNEQFGPWCADVARAILKACEDES